MWKVTEKRGIISQGLLMQWRRKAGVTKFTEGLKKCSEKCNGMTVKTFEESNGEGQEKQADLTKSTNSDGKEMKPGRCGLKKPFYSAEMRSRVLSHYR